MDSVPPTTTVQGLDKGRVANEKPGTSDFYDPEIDMKDEAWAERQRKGRKSDAILSCPACFTSLCIDCQRHELHMNQYRAMFVRNCRVVETERLQLMPGQKKRKRSDRRRGRQQENKDGGGPGMLRLGMPTVPAATDIPVGEEIFKPVRCAECGTEVAVFDSDEVYHFFNVVPSYS
ncbi:hypothetical protein BDL97_03G050700 [Sphagnum fallax]|nr:hypothetical protein BDL97_03G050700 [Sphagnum fallax]